MGKLIFIIFVAFVSVQASAGPLPVCEYLGFSQGRDGYGSRIIDECHYIKNPEGGIQIRVGCAFSLTDGIKAVAIEMKRLEATGKCRIEATDCLAGAVRNPFRLASGAQCYANPAVWIGVSSNFEAAAHSWGAGATFRRFEREFCTGSGCRIIDAITTPASTMNYIGAPGMYCSGDSPKDLGDGLIEARETLEFLGREGICKAQQFPIPCRNYQLNDFPGVVYESQPEVIMDGKIEFYRKAGICN
ncbi:MAG: hypothetical protein KF799_09465 [Bdellovibrionales bacterium]|nr:hypothetical protein [Bdellovibrionales bacterium]